MLRCIRFVFAAFWFAIACSVGAALTILRPFHPRNGAVFCRFASPLMFKILGIKVVGPTEAEMDARAPCFFIANHQSTLDLFVIGSFIPYGTVSVGKKSLAWIPVFGWLYWLSGAFFIDRGNSIRAQETLKRVGRTMRRKNMSIIFFPEGTRSQGRALLPFKKGVFHLALETQLPIQPLVVSTYRKALDYNQWNAGTLHVSLMPKIAAPINREQINSVLQTAHDVMKRELARLDRD